MSPSFLSDVLTAGHCVFFIHKLIHPMLGSTNAVYRFLSINMMALNEIIRRFKTSVLCTYKYMYIETEFYHLK